MGKTSKKFSSHGVKALRTIIRKLVKGHFLSFSKLVHLHIKVKSLDKDIASLLLRCKAKGVPKQLRLDLVELKDAFFQNDPYDSPSHRSQI